MDADRFDSLVRSLTTVGFRRRTLATVVTGAIGLLGLAGADDVAAGKSGKCKPKCGECQTCDKGKCNKKNGKKRCKKGKCKAKGNGTGCSTGTCQSGSCVASGGGVPLQSCTSNAECGVESNGAACACRTTSSGQQVCTKPDGRFIFGGTCGSCQGAEQCSPTPDGVVCVLPCRA